jgi:hypothetical protein
MKKIWFIILLILLSLHNAIGQESAKNTLYGGIGTSLSGLFWGSWNPLFALGLNIEYEYSFNDRYSVSIDTGIDPVVSPFVEIKGRWYPWEETFFVGLGMGIWGFTPPMISLAYFLRFSISPTIGWKIDIGKQNGWVIMPKITSRLLIKNDDTLPLIGELFIVNFNIGYMF